MAPWLLVLIVEAWWRFGKTKNIFDGVFLVFVSFTNDNVGEFKMTKLHKDYDLTIRNIMHQGKDFIIGSNIACIDGVYYEIVNNAFSGEKDEVHWNFYELVKCSDVKLTSHENGFSKDLSSEITYYFAYNVNTNNLLFVEELKLQTIFDKHLDWRYIGTHIESYRYAREKWLGVF
ncbi:MAG: hypothetical protein QM504_10165 [Pseudomonadota bacterium]